MNDKGWISIHRQLKQHWLWRDSVKLQWWLDILLSVNTSSVKINIGNDIIECKRGQTIKSLQTWAADWKTSKDKVRNFFRLLEKDGMITLENIKISTRLTVCKYDSYQSNSNATQTQPKRKANATQTQTHPNNNEDNNDNENNEDNLFNTGSNEPQKEHYFVILFNEITGRKMRGFSEKSKRQLKNLKDKKYTPADFETAIRNGYQNSTRWDKPDLFTPEYITREDKFLQFLNWQTKSTPGPQKQNQQHGIKHLDPNAPDYYDRLKEHYAVSQAS